MKKRFFLLFLYLTPAYLFAGNLEKGFEALKVYNYFEAKKYFVKSLKNDAAGSAYGMSTIFYRNDNPFHNIDSAYKYILLSEKSFKLCDAKEMAHLSELTVTQASIDKLKDGIILLAFERAKKINTDDALNDFIKRFPHPILSKEAKKYRGKLAFENAKKQNTPQVYKDFIANYPNADEINDAKWLYDFSLFSTVTKPNNLENYEAFVKQYPKSPYRTQAEDSIFYFSTLHKSIDEYYFFIKKYPDNHNVKKAWDVVYQLSTIDFSPDRIQKFIKDFPDYPDKSKANLDLLRSKMYLFPISQNGKYGFINSNGAVVIPFNYDWADNFSEGMAVVTIDEKSGYISKSGSTLLLGEFDEANAFHNSVAIVKKGDKYGLIHKLGKQLLPFEYEDIIGNESKDKIVIALKEKTYFYFTLSCQLLFQGKYEAVGAFSLGKAYVIQDGKYGFIDKAGKTIVAPQYDWVESFKTNGLARVKQNEKFGMIDTTGKIILPCEYNVIDECSEKVIRIVKDKKFGFSNESGQIIIPIKYDYSPEISVTKGFTNGYVKVELLKKRGLMDTTGKFILPCEYDDVGNFHEDVCAIRKGKLWGYIDKSKKIKINPQFEYAWDFLLGLAKVKQKNKIGFINHNGTPLIPIIYDDATDFNNGISVVIQLGLKGLIDTTGKIIIPCQMNEIKEIGEQIFKLEKNNKISYYSVPLQKQIWTEDGF